MKSCDNPSCNRKVELNIMYCCPLCAASHEGKYSPVHTVSCNERNGFYSIPSPTEGLEVALHFKDKDKQ